MLYNMFIYLFVKHEISCSQIERIQKKCYVTLHFFVGVGAIRHGGYALSAINECQGLCPRKLSTEHQPR